MPKIENISYMDAKAGNHAIAAENAVMIRIVDINRDFPPTRKKYKKVLELKFADIVQRDLPAVKYHDAFQEGQAFQVVAFLQEALANGDDVVVHCMAGISRSGAVVEIGSIMGFEPVRDNRQPNLRMKYMMMKQLGLTYD